MLFIHGMRDNDCRERVASALGSIPGVVDVHVSLIRARAEVLHAIECAAARLVQAVSDAGYGATLDSGNGPQ